MNSESELPPIRTLRVTQREIADRLGLSLATVSLSLSDSPLVADVTRQRVHQTARDLGYVYNRSAASLRKQSSGIIGVCIHDITNPFFATVITALEDEIGRRRGQILFNQHGESRDRQNAFIATMREYSVDGLILCPAPDTDRAEVERIVSQGTPVVLVSRALPDSALDTSAMDDRAAMDLAVSHLISQGHRRIAMVGGLRGTSTGEGRLAGYRDAIIRGNLPLRQEYLALTGPRRTDAAEAVNRLLDLPEPPTALACLNDVMAFGAMSALRRAGRQPGTDMAITGIGDVPEAADWQPALTTVSATPEEMGRRAAVLLFDRMSEPSASPRREILSPVLVVRDSSPPPNGPAT